MIDMIHKKNFKGASPIGGMLFAAVIILIAAFGLLGWVGSYQLATGEAVNASLASSYNAVLGPSGALGYPTGGIFNNVSSFNTSTRNVIGGGVPNTAVGGLGLIFSLNPISLITALINTLIVNPLVSVGIPAGFAWIMAGILITLMVSLTVISALLIFPLL